MTRQLFLFLFQFFDPAPTIFHAPLGMAARHGGERQGGKSGRSALSYKFFIGLWSIVEGLWLKINVKSFACDVMLI